MSGRDLGRYDVAVVGAGPVGCVAAVAHARRGARVVLLEANPRASRRLAGEWLHPPAVEVLRRLEVPLPAAAHASGLGFVVCPDDGSGPIRLPYADGTRGLCMNHERLVSALRGHAAALEGIDYVAGGRVSAVQGHRLGLRLNGSRESATVRAERIVGADGGRSIVRQAIGAGEEPLAAASIMVGLAVRDAGLPFEGYGHVFLGGPGPVLAYRISASEIRIIADLPARRATNAERAIWLWERYAPVLPPSLRAPFHAALRRERLHGAPNHVCLRTRYGKGHCFLAGDAVGRYHPLTAVGMTLGFGDAECMAEADSVEAYQRVREAASRVPESLAIGLQVVFADPAEEAVETRRAIVRRWQTSARVRRRTMGHLSCQDATAASFLASCAGTVGSALAALARGAAVTGRWGHAARVAGRVGSRAAWLLLGLWGMHHDARGGRPRALARLARDWLAHGLRVSAEPHGWARHAPDTVGATVTAGPALERAADRLADLQRPDGSWEGEMVWCPMLTAQYVLALQIMGRAVDPRRRAGLLRHFAASRLPGGCWGLHAHAPPSLFVTTLVYVAARVLGASRDDPLLLPAARFIEDAGGVGAIPTWGKFWLAMLGLGEWRDLYPVLPELWSLPRWAPLHPSRLYCHTRLIYMAMAVLWAERGRLPRVTLPDGLERELRPRSGATPAGPRALHAADAHAPPGRLLRLGQELTVLVERWHRPGARRRIVAALRKRIRFELATTAHTSISPVSGLLNVLALHLSDPDDADARRAFQSLEGWIWEDAERGTRLTGARSASWDTAFALQALGAVPASRRLETARARGSAYLAAQQIRTSVPGFAAADRLDPAGGWCFAAAWHGWPVSDCTAEAVAALAHDGAPLERAPWVEEATRFMLRCQNPDGGFGSYEASRSRVSLEWANPAEMFADCMVDRSWVECTASCVSALAIGLPALTPDTRAAAASAVERGARWLVRAQRDDGSWPGAWGVSFIYGTSFGVRGLVGAGYAPTHPAVSRGCRWLIERQRADGGWGEHHSTCRTGIYAGHDESQVVQTAWAMLALLEAGHPDWDALEAAAAFLVRTQDDRGEWPEQDMAGVFFRTSLLDYRLYRFYFPTWALALYERRRRERAGLENAGAESVLASPARSVGAGCS